MSEIINDNSVYQNDEDIYGKKIKAVPAPQKPIGIDVDGEMLDNIINAGKNGQLDISKIESFTQVAQNRENIYRLIDTMSEDSTVAAVLETYAEDATETNEQGRIMWCTSDKPEVADFVTFLLDTMNVDKNLYKWTYSLIKYGDLYLRLFHESEYQMDNLFGKKDSLNEDVNLKVFSKKDNYAHYMEMMPNPAELFELTKFGKSYAYIQANVTTQGSKQYQLANSYYKYAFKKKDINVYEATNFVHACLEDTSSRVPEEVSIYLDDDEKSGDVLSYTVRRGQSILYTSFKTWRELMLLQNSLLLNRLTKSSILRVINVEVGDMPKDRVGPHLMGIKQLIEQKSAIDNGNSMSEYTNPGPMENNIYIPTHNGIGNLSTQQIGGDVDVKGLGDIDYFKNRFFGALRVPKQYFGETDDSTGFNGGTSLSIISSRYGKAIKRIQNTMIQAITDAINLMLIDKGLDSYINQFQLQMVTPATQEEINRRDNMSAKIGICRDILDLTSDIENPIARLKILKSLLSDTITDTDVIATLQEEIDNLETDDSTGSSNELNNVDDNDSDSDDIGISHDGNHMALPSRNDNSDMNMPIENNDFEDTEESPDISNAGDEQILPTPAELASEIDFSDNSQF